MFKRKEVMLLILLLAVKAVGIYSSPAIAKSNPEVTTLPSLEINSIDKMSPCGEYVIYVLSDNKWQEAGKIPFVRFFREKKIDLSRFLPDVKTATIRIEERGGGAAHIDSVFLGNSSPQSIKGINDTLTLKKLSKKDFDVIDAFGKTFELVFPSTEKDKTLKITARIEGTKISKTPFQVPTENTYKPMNESARFYEYKPDVSGSKSITEPFFI